MINQSISKKSHDTCFQCGSELIFISKEIIKPEGSRFAQVNTIYKCSNSTCQGKKDKEKADRIILQQKKTELAKVRLEQMQQKRELTKQAKAKSI